MMMSAILLVLMTAPGDPAWVGATTCSMNRVVIERDGRQFRAIQGSGLQANDVLRTEADAGASFLLGDSQVIYLGPATEVRLALSGADPTVVLVKGEIRVTSGEGSLALQTDHAMLRLGRAVVRAESDRYGSRFFAEHGVAQVVRGEQYRQTLSQGQEFQIRPHSQGISTRRGEGWKIKLVDYQMASAASAGEQERWRATPENNARPNPTDDRQKGATRDRRDEEEDDEDELPDAPDPAATDRGAPQTASQQSSQPGQLNSNATGSVSSLALGGLAAATGAPASGGLFADANQQTTQGMLTRDFQNLSAGDPFPGNIHLITREDRYSFSSVQLTPAERAALFPSGGPSYFSIGLGAPPQGQVTTDFGTASAANPHVVQIPQFNAYLVRLDQYGAIDSALDPIGARNTNVGITGLIGNPPVAPSINGATPLPDARAEINALATFALGELRVRPDGQGLEFAVRRSDQDRIIVKDPGNNDALDQVTPNSQVSQYDDVADPRFQPAAPTVKVPGINAFNGGPSTRYSDLDYLRKAAVTTLVADQLFEYSRRTGQTRFVVRDGAQSRIIDITGYRP